MLTLLLICTTSIAQAEVVNLTAPNKMLARADYRVGDADKPIVLILHGFLQTDNSYQTIQTLKTEMNDAGYTVIAPTLTLGINNRRQSLDCETIHTHTMQHDVDEITMWVDWVQKKHPGKKIHAVGHSYGNVQLLAYLTSAKRPVDKFIAVGIVSVRKQAYDKQLPLVLEQMKLDPHALQNYKRSFCKKYVSPPKTVLTYLNWTNDRILTNLTSANTSYDAYVIIGSKDDRVTPDWQAGIANSKSKLITISGANHFFSGEHEFDVVDEITAVLK